jgi:hypothetical protein
MADGRQLQSQASERRLRAFPERLFAQAEAGGLTTQQNIVRDGERRDKIDLLIDGADAGGWLRHSNVER